MQGVTKISVLRGRSSRSLQHAETIRKMLFAMVKDVRVILIKLADKLHNMRTLGYLDEEDRKRIAMETLDIYAPARRAAGHLAHQGRAGGPEPQAPAARRLRADPPVRGRPQERARQLPRAREGGHHARRPPRRASPSRSRPGPSTSTRSTRRCAGAGSRWRRSTTCWACACSARRPASATSCSASCTSSGCPSRAGSRTTSPCRSPTATRACTPR